MVLFDKLREMFRRRAKPGDTTAREAPARAPRRQAELTPLEQLVQAKANVLALILEITAVPKPTYFKDDQSVSWETYLATLVAQIPALNAAIVIEAGAVAICMAGAK